jgi:hypothetical protein
MDKIIIPFGFCLYLTCCLGWQTSKPSTDCQGNVHCQSILDGQMIDYCCDSSEPYCPEDNTNCSEPFTCCESPPQ